MFETVRSLSMPTVAMVNGPAMGGGTVFLFLCDYVFLSQDAYVQFSEVRKKIFKPITKNPNR